jgi:hypothetical protein
MLNNDISIYNPRFFLRRRGGGHGGRRDTEKGIENGKKKRGYTEQI